MPKITLYSKKQTSATSVSNVFIDEYMSNANGEFVKIYLFLLRKLSSPDADFSLSEIADKFEHTEKDVKRALCYWERMQLLHLIYDSDENLVSIELRDALSKNYEKPPLTPDTNTKKAAFNTPEPLPNTFPSAEAPAAPQVVSSVSNTPHSAEDMKQFMEQDAVAELLFIAEQYLGRTLTVTDLNAVFYWYEELKLSPELIEYLIEYCVSKGHSSIRYMEKVALAWSQNHYQTVEQAKLANGQYNQAYNTVMKAFGITGRSFVSLETNYIDKWKNDYGFSIAMIQAACEKTIQTIHEPSFPYADSILNDWKANHIETLADVAHADSAHQKKKKNAAPAITAAARKVSKNKFTNFDQRAYDYDQLEKMLLTTSLK